jgi:hypothetical protein
MRGRYWTKKKMAVVDGIEQLYAFYFVDNGSEWFDLYENCGEKMLTLFY